MRSRAPSISTATTRSASPTCSICWRAGAAPTASRTCWRSWRAGARARNRGVAGSRCPGLRVPAIVGVLAPDLLRLLLRDHAAAGEGDERALGGIPGPLEGELLQEELRRLLDHRPGPAGRRRL